MKIIVIGASGTVGQAVAKELAQRHELIGVGTNSGHYRADMADIAQVRALFAQTGKVDAVVVAAGRLHLGPLAGLEPEHFQVGLASKLMGQVNVAQVAAGYLNDGGSITLTSGIITERPIRGGAGAAMANAALEAYAGAAAVELGRGLRINVVSPGVLEESMEAYGPYFPGIEAVPGKRVALGYVRSVEGVETGKVFKVW